MTTTETVKVGRWQRNSAGVLFAASLVAILVNAGILVISVVSFGSASAMTVQVPDSDSTSLGGAGMVAYYSEAIVWSTGVSFWPQAWLSIARILWALVWITVAICVLAFSYGAYHGEVFTRRLPKLIAIAAVAVGAGGTVANGIAMSGTAAAMAELANGDSSLVIESWMTSSDPTWTLLTGLLLALLAIVFRSGLRLQRDTEGLV